MNTNFRIKRFTETVGLGGSTNNRDNNTRNPAKNQVANTKY